MILVMTLSWWSVMTYSGEIWHDSCHVSDNEMVQVTCKLCISWWWPNHGLIMLWSDLKFNKIQGGKRPRVQDSFFEVVSSQFANLDWWTNRDWEHIIFKQTLSSLFSRKWHPNPGSYQTNPKNTLETNRLTQSVAKGLKLNQTKRSRSDNISSKTESVFLDRIWNINIMTLGWIAIKIEYNLYYYIIYIQIPDSASDVT